MPRLLNELQWAILADFESKKHGVWSADAVLSCVYYVDILS